MKWVHTIIIGTVLTMSALSLGYFLYQPKADEVEQRIDITPEYPVVTSENTMVEYIYDYQGDDVQQVTYSQIPPYLINLTKEQVQEKMLGFEITYFSQEKITAQKSLAGNSRQHYVLGEKDGYLAVYYQKGGGLKELTNTPVSSLSAQEIEMLGVTEIVGNDNLSRVLEDLES